MSVLEENRRMSAYRMKSTSSQNSEVASVRRPSLKEMPSYRDEASKALNRREELTRLKDRLSSDREILNADPSTKPWLRRSSSRQEGLTPLTEDGTYTASPAMIYGGGVVASSSPIAPVPNLRSRNLSRGTSSSDYSEGSFNSDSYYEY